MGLSSGTKEKKRIDQNPSSHFVFIELQQVSFTFIAQFNSDEEQDLRNFLGAMYAAILFLGASNAAAVQPVITIERTVFYRERAAGMYSPLPYAFSQVTNNSVHISRSIPYKGVETVKLT